MKRLCLAVACALLPLSAFAQEPAAPADGAPTYAVPVESLEIGGARAHFMETGGSAGGYAVTVRSSAMQTNILTRNRTRVTLNYRFVGADETELLTGACRLQSGGRSLLGVHWNQSTSELYACEARDQPEGAYAMEVTLPAFRETSFGIGGVSISAGEDETGPEAHAILHARLSFDGVAYDAAPTGFGRENPMMDRRVVEGYIISRDGQPVGRIDFSGNSNNRGTIAAPVADADGRRAVLFMALQLLAMPDFYSSHVRQQYLNR